MLETIAKLTRLVLADKICRKKNVQGIPLYFHILAEGGDVMNWRIVDIKLELAEAERQ